jgi:hypothetical protein
LGCPGADANEFAVSASDDKKYLIPGGHLKEISDVITFWENEQFQPTGKRNLPSTFDIKTGE